MNAEEGRYYCFGCRASGDQITFVREMQHLDFVDAVRLLADRRLMFQAVLNLVANAVKFTPPGGTVDLRFVLTKEGGVEIVVHDTGIGIAPENIERVFVPFEQVESSLARKNGGTGLGLPYAKKLVELHGGTLRLASEVNKGTTVTISLPADRVVSEPLQVAV